MAKTSGLGDNFYIGGYDLSSDVSALTKISGGPALLDVTPINAFANVRLGGLRSGEIDFTTAFDPDPASLTGEHTYLSQLPNIDTIATYFRGTTIGNPACSCIGKQVNYDPTRGSDGSISIAVQVMSNSFGLEWGTMMTPGIRTDTTATAASSANSFDTGAAASFGGQAYLQVFGVTGTSCTVAVWDSADNITFAAVTSFAFAAATPAGSPQNQRISISNTSTIRRYMAIATTGTFSNAQFAVQVTKNTVAGVTF